MKLFGALFSIVLLFATCAEKQTNLAEYLRAANKIEIVFTGSNSTKSMSKTITDSGMVQLLATAINGRETPAYKCGSDGILKFYNNDLELLQAEFIFMQKDCMHFAFDYDNKPHFVTMPTFAKTVFEGLSASAP